MKCGMGIRWRNIPIALKVPPHNFATLASSVSSISAMDGGSTCICPAVRDANKSHQFARFAALHAKNPSSLFLPTFRHMEILRQHCVRVSRSLVDLCLSKVTSSAEVCSAEVCVAEVCIAEICPDERCPAEVCPDEVCPAEVCVAEVCPDEV